MDSKLSFVKFPAIIMPLKIAAANLRTMPSGSNSGAIGGQTALKKVPHHGPKSHSPKRRREYRLRMKSTPLFSGATLFLAPKRLRRLRRAGVILLISFSIYRLAVVIVVGLGRLRLLPLFLLAAEAAVQKVVATAALHAARN